MLMTRLNLDVLPPLPVYTICNGIGFSFQVLPKSSVKFGMKQKL